MPARLVFAPLTVASLLFGVPVALGIVVSVVRLLGIRYPNLGWATTVNSDAEELYLGHTLYQNPAHGYTGQIYTPLFPVIISLFDHIYLWNGWALLIVIAAAVSLVTLAARVAYAPASRVPRTLRILGAAGVGGIAYWCVSSVGLPLLDEARADQMAWALALFGLVAVADFGTEPSSRRVIAAALLLSAALWTKQTTVAVVAPATIWVIALTAGSALRLRAGVLFVALLCALNLALLGLLNVLTHGWELYFNFEMATRQATEKSYGTCLTLALRSIVIACGFVAFTWSGSAARAIARRRAWLPRSHAQARNSLRTVLVAEDPAGRRILLLAGYIVVGFALAVYFMRKQGTETNQMIGVVWALGLLAAAGWRAAQPRIGAATIVGGCVALLFVLAQLRPVDRLAARADVTVPALEEAVRWPVLPAEWLAWTRHHTLYSPVYSDLNVAQGGPLYPNYFNFADLLAAGNQPLYLVHALLNRRFDGVEYFSLEGNNYTSGMGKWEENYLWKLDAVITARYVSERGLPPGVLARRPGPEQASWMRHCFGPFTAGGASFRIHHGGGFWCSFAPDRLQLVSTPTPFSEVVTTQPVRASGEIGLTLAGGSARQLVLQFEGGPASEWAARVATTPREPHTVVVSTLRGNASLGSVRVPASNLPGGRLGVELELAPTGAQPGPPLNSGQGRATVPVPEADARFEMIATPGIALNLSAASFRH